MMSGFGTESVGSSGGTTENWVAVGVVAENSDDATTTEGFVARVFGIAASTTEDGRTDITRGVPTKLGDLGLSDRVTSPVMGKVDGWMGIREIFWPACACRATSEIARPVGTGGPRAKVDFGTGLVADRG